MKRVLFLCTGNSCRSQMAEAWLRNLGGDGFEAYSAGLEAHGLDPQAVAVMAEVGVDISQQKSELIDDYVADPFDYFITVCDHAREACPVTPPGCQRLHWSFLDPPSEVQERGLTGDEARAVYRRVRDEIRAEVEGFLKQV